MADAMISRRLLQARGWKVVTVSEHEWVRLKNVNDKTALIEARVDKVKSLEPAKGL